MRYPGPPAFSLTILAADRARRLRRSIVKRVGFVENRQEFRHLANALRLGKCVQSLSYGVDVNDVNLTAVRAQLRLESFYGDHRLRTDLARLAAADNM